MIAEIVYLLCTFLSLACCVLLLRAYAQRRVRLLLWSGLCFAGLCLNNALLFTDMVVFPAADLSVVRLFPALLGVSILCYGLIWDAN